MEKRWSRKGSVSSGLIVLGGEAGFQPEVLRGGVHWRMPFQYAVHIMPLVTIPQGKIGIVFARDGVPLPRTQALASNFKANDFEDTRAFLRSGGQRGPQRQILREGTYAIFSNGREFPGIILLPEFIGKVVGEDGARRAEPSTGPTNGSPEKAAPEVKAAAPRSGRG